MFALLTAAGTAATIGFLGYLIYGGFRDGDRQTDVIVRAHPARAGVGAPELMVDVEIDNRAPSTALVALALRQAWRPRWVSSTVARRSVSGRFRPALSDQTVGVVQAGETGAFRLQAEGARRAFRLDVVVGTSQRLRLHRIGISTSGAPRNAERDAAACGSTLGHQSGADDESRCSHGLF